MGKIKPASMRKWKRVSNNTRIRFAFQRGKITSGIGPLARLINA
jgi:hypothetical protein